MNRRHGNNKLMREKWKWKWKLEENGNKIDTIFMYF